MIVSDVGNSLYKNPGQASGGIRAAKLQQIPLTHKSLLQGCYFPLPVERQAWRVAEWAFSSTGALDKVIEPFLGEAFRERLTRWGTAPEYGFRKKSSKPRP